MAWFGKTIVIEKGVNWEQMLIDIGKGVEACKGNIGHTKNEISTFKKEFNEHCQNEEKDKNNLKEHICKKIEEIKCPKGDEISGLVMEKKQQNGQIKKLSDEFKETKGSVDAMMLRADGEKKTWKKLKIRTTYILVTISAVTGIVTKILEYW